MTRADSSKRWPAWLLSGLVFVIFAALALQIGVSHYAAHILAKTLNDLDKNNVFNLEIEFSALRGLDGIAGIIVTRQQEPDRNPLVELEDVRINVEWLGLLAGTLAVDINIGSAAINLLKQDFETLRTTFPEDQREREAFLTRVKEAPINDVEIGDAHLTYSDIAAKNPFVLAVTEISVTAENMVDARLRETTPASIRVTAKLLDGHLKAFAQTALFEQDPGVSVEFVVNALNLADAREAIEEYTSVDVKSGTLDAAGRILIDGSYMQGFGRQKITDLSLEPLKDPGDLVSKQFAAMIMQSLTDGPASRFSDQVTFDADLSEIEGGRMLGLFRMLQAGMVKLFNVEKNETLTTADLDD